MLGSQQQKLILCSVIFLCVNSSREEGVGGYTNQVVAYPYWTGARLYRLPAVQQDHET